VYSGTWFEVRDNDGSLLYRRRFCLPEQVEVHGDSGFMGRGEIPDEVTPPIDIIVPDLKEVAVVLLFAVNAPERGTHPRRRIAQPIPFAVFKRSTKN
jgi:hypothetical protein